MVSPAEIKIMAMPMTGDAEMREIPSERSLKMAYKKPQMVAKSSAKKSYVAGCPAKTSQGGTACGGRWGGESCEILRTA